MPLIDNEKMERRFPKVAELRVDAGKEGSKIVGYASVFNQWADIGGIFRERVKPGAFAKSIKESDVRALWNHDERFVLGRNKSGTLTLEEDEQGLRVEIDPVPATWAKDLMVSMQRGDVNQMSFGFTVNKQDVNYERNERTLVDVSLFDVSVVTYPAYPTTTAQVRGMFQKQDVEEQQDEWALFDELIAKVKRGEDLTEDEIRSLTHYIPAIASPAESHAAQDTTPAESHAEPEQVRKNEDYSDRLVRLSKYLATGVTQ